MDRTTIDINTYEYVTTERCHVLDDLPADKIVFIDTPNVFDKSLDIYEKSCNHLENIFKKVENIDVVMFCISATKYNTRKIDLEAFTVLRNFHDFLEQTRIVASRKYLLDEQNFSKFMVNALRIYIPKIIKFMLFMTKVISIY